MAPSWPPPLKVQFTTPRDEGKLTGVYGTGRVTVVDRNDALPHREDRDVLEALRGLFVDDRTSVNDNLPPNGYRTTLMHDRMEALCLLLPACPPGGHGDHRTADPDQRASSPIRLTA